MTNYSEQIENCKRGIARKEKQIENIKLELKNLEEKKMVK